MTKLNEFYVGGNDRALEGYLAACFPGLTGMPDDETSFDVIDKENSSQTRYISFLCKIKDNAVSEDNTATRVYSSSSVPMAQGPIIYVGNFTLRSEQYFYGPDWDPGTSGPVIHLLEPEGRESIELSNLNYILKDLYQIYQEHSMGNWNGYGAVSMSKNAYLESAKVLRLLPSFVPVPEILPEPDGSIGLDWYREKNFSFAISVSGKNILAYAGLFGNNTETHGEEAFGDSIPKVILDNLKRLFNISQ